MKKKIASAAKKVLGKKTYTKLRSKYVFNDLSSPFPMYQIKDIEMDWSTFEKSGGMTQVVYIVSPTQRSGTNFLSHVMGKHPDLVFPEKKKFSDEHCLYSYVNDIKKYCLSTVATWGKWTESEDHTLVSQVKKLMANTGEGILKYFSEDLQEGQMLLLKTPDSGNVEDFFHLFPNSKVVVLMRDGRDTVESFLKSWGGSESFKKMTSRWSNRVDQIDRLLERAKHSGFEKQVHVLDYNNLNEDTPGELKKVFEFLELNQDNYPWGELADTPVLGSSNYRGGEENVHWKPIAKDSGFKPAGKWNDWNKSKKNLFKRIAGKQLQNHGFSKDNDW